MAVTTVSVARIAACRVRADLITAGGRIAAGGPMAAGGLAAVSRVRWPRGRGALTGAVRPGVAPGALVPRFTRLGRRTLSPVSVVLAVRRCGHRLGHRGRVLKGGRRVRVRGGVPRPKG